jgi:hypothetical protein
MERPFAIPLRRQDEATRTLPLVQRGMITRRRRLMRAPSDQPTSSGMPHPDSETGRLWVSVVAWCSSGSPGGNALSGLGNGENALASSVEPTRARF